MNYIDNTLLEDLEIYNKVVPALDKTITIYGHTKFKELFGTMLCEQNDLLARRQIIESIILNNKHKTKLTFFLKKIHKLESSITWLFEDNKEEYGELCFKREYFNTKELVTTSNYMKIGSSALILVIYILVYLVMRYAGGISMSLKDYFYSVYMSYQAMISGILYLALSNINFISFATNFLATMYVFYNVYSMYSGLETSVSHYRKCNNFTSKIMNIRKFLNYTKQIYKYDIFTNKETQSLNELDDLFENDKINSFGYSVLLKKNIMKYEYLFNNILQKIGEIDAYINIANLVTVNEFVFPQFDFNSQEPYIDAFGAACSYIPKYQQILNDCHLGNPNNMIITGPNTSGKSTFIRNVMTCILLAQTIGVTCCNNLVFTPFFSLFSYLNIPNIQRNKESLFEAEIMRCLEYCNKIQNLNKFSFTIMDELFTGTNPKEGISSSYAVCNYIGKFKKSLSIITTHFNELTNLEQTEPNNFFNMKFTVDRDMNNNFMRSYLISPGISDQNIAIELLQKKGYNNTIIENAIKKLGDLIN